jgi:hypothetical protein
MDAHCLIVYSFRDVKEFFYYEDKSGCPKPKCYPCVMVKDYENGGLGGDFVSHRFEYAPNNVDFRSWAIGKGTPDPCNVQSAVKKGGG